MNDKKWQFNKDARTSMLEGMEVLATAVGSTLGPKGQCVVIDDYLDNKPLVTKDGVTVAKSIQLRDKFKNLGVQLLKEASIRTVETAGDATTTTVVLAYNLINAAQELIDAGENPIKVKNTLKPYFDAIIQNLKDQAVPVTAGDVKKIATISSNNDSEIGSLINEAFEKIGTNGVITVEESSNVRTYTDVITGMQFDRGYESLFFATFPSKCNCVLENCLILLTDQKIQITRDLVPVLEIAVKLHKPILIIAQDYDDEVIQNLKINKMQNIVSVCAVKAPSYGTYRSDILEDIAILTGGKVITYESGIELTKVTEEMLGKCGKVIVTKETTTIVDGKGDKDVINSRVEQIKNLEKQLSGEIDRDFLKDFYAQRVAKLSGGIAVIYVGGTTEIEMREKKDRIEDAVCATKAAIEEGIVPGGGMSFINALTSANYPGVLSDDYANVLNALYSVKEKIITNCGLDSDSYEDCVGFDAVNEEPCNVLERGIINPAKSDRLALENAISVLNLYLSSSCLIVDEEMQF